MFQILKEDESESKIIKFVIDVAPKRIIIKGEFEAQLDKIINEPLKIKNLCNIQEGVMVTFKPISNEDEILKPNKPAENSVKTPLSAVNRSKDRKKTIM